MERNRKFRPQCRNVRGRKTFPEGAIFVAPNTKRHDTARRWAERRTREELIDAVALLFQRRAEDRIELYARYLLDVGAPEYYRKKAAADNAKAKLTKNASAKAIQAAKQQARTFWKERRNGKHPKLVTELQFALEVCSRWPVLTSADKVRAWAREWRKEADLEPKVARVVEVARSRNDAFSMLPDVVATAVVGKWPKAEFGIARAIACRLLANADK